ncbi:filament-like protein [Actinidia rufa]|uniref:Filament-like protein n=1 Tax=Actinidia rufa TaxID=165716 RepID=A0A7J0FBA0_9ERIC|nr:filament-like protein [Actinidia rufa]
MEEGGSLMEHMNVFNGYLNQLRKVDVKIDEEDKALLLLTSLPDSYDTLVTTLLYGKDTVSLEQVQSSLVSHCTQKRSSFEDGENAALAVQSGNRGKKSDGRSGWSNGSSSSSRGKGVQCYYCKEFGHVKRDCPLRKDKGKKCDDASSCNSLVVADDGDCLTVSEGINTSSHDEWILDSGCTKHVCSKKEFFDTFQERDGGSLFLGDGTPCKIQGVGNVKIKMFDGAVRTLGGVVYIPKLRRNLISLSRMDSNGCKYFAGGGAMKITRGGKVLMKGEKCKGLYRLIGKTVYSTKVWKRCAQGSGYPRCESFAAKTKLCFQVADGCEGVKLVGREDGSRADLVSCLVFEIRVFITSTMKATINSQFSLERFNGNSSFTLWQRRVKDILVQQGLAKALKGNDAKPETLPGHPAQSLIVFSRNESCVVADSDVKNNQERDLAATTEQLAESQESILLLRKQLKALRPQKEFMGSPYNTERNQKMSASLNKNQLPVLVCTKCAEVLIAVTWVSEVQNFA